MTTINLGTKIVSSAAATSSFRAESRSGLDFEMTLQSSSGVAHNGSAGRVALYLGRSGKNQDLLAWVRGVASGVYSVAAGTALTVPRLSLVCLDSVYSFGLWWEPDSGSPVLLYTGDLQIIASQGGVVDLTPGAGATAVELPVQQTIEIAGVLDVSGNATALATPAAVRAPYGGEIVVRVTVPPTQVTGTASGTLNLANAQGTPIGEPIALSVVSTGVFEGVIGASQQALIHDTDTISYTTWISPESGVRKYLSHLAGQITMIPTGVTLNQPASIAITYPINDGTLYAVGDVTVGFAAQDLDGYLSSSNIVALLDGAQVDANVAVTLGAGTHQISGNVTVNVAAYGPHVITLRCTDSRGDSTVAQRSIVAQQLSIATPSSGVTVDEGTIVATVLAQPAVPANTAVQLLVGGVASGSSGTVGGGATTGNLTAGTALLAARMVVSGVTVTSAAIPITVADQNPVPTITSHTASQRVSTGSLAVYGIVTHPTASPAQLVVEFALDGTAFESPVSATYNSGTSRWEATLTVSTESMHTIRMRSHDRSSPTEWIVASPVVVNSMPGFVRFTAAAGTYAPTVGLAPGSTATVTWTCEETNETQTTLTPSFTVTGTQHIRMVVSGDAFADVLWVNHGFNYLDDRGRESLPSSFNKPTDPLVFAENLGNLTGMTYWLYARGNFRGVLDVRGCSALTHIEMFRTHDDPGTQNDAGATNVLLEGTALRRICMEQNLLGYGGQVLDLNPVRTTLYDVRMAGQRHSSLTLAPLTGTGWQVYHWCTNSQQVINLPPPSILPLCEEWLIWNVGLSGTWAVNAAALQLEMVGDSPEPTMSNRATGFDFSALPSNTSIHTVRLRCNALTRAAVDSILTQLDDRGMHTGTIDLGDTSQPSATGIEHANNLRARGVQVSYRTDEATGVASDSFDAASTPAERGWKDFVWGAYVRQADGLGYLSTDTGDVFDGYRVAANPGDGVTNATPNYEVELVISAAACAAAIAAGTFGAYMGVLIRGKYLYDGIAVRWPNLGECRVGIPADPGNNPIALVVENALPASWTSGSADRTLLVRANGATLQIYCDGTLCYSATCHYNETAQNTYYGILGGGSATLRYPSITTRALA